MTGFASEEFHNKGVDYLNSHPAKLIIDRNGSHCLTDIVLAGEMNMFDVNSHNPLPIGKPDGVLFGKYGDIYVFEYKPSGGHRKRALEQLRRAQEHFQRYFQVRSRMFYISGDQRRGFDVREVQ